MVFQHKDVFKIINKNYSILSQFKDRFSNLIVNLSLQKYNYLNKVHELWFTVQPNCWKKIGHK